MSSEYISYRVLPENLANSVAVVTFGEGRPPVMVYLSKHAVIRERDGKPWDLGGYYELTLTKAEAKKYDLWPKVETSGVESISAPAPVPLRLLCEVCHELHVDVPPWDTRPHHTHTCQHCGCSWRPGIVHTVGVRFLPGFRNEEGEK